VGSLIHRSSYKNFSSKFAWPRSYEETSGGVQLSS
jgi:hypothetical protein